MRNILANRLKREFRLFNLSLLGFLVLVVLIEVGTVYMLGLVLGRTLMEWVPTLAVSTLVLVSIVLIVMLLVSGLGSRVRAVAAEGLTDELRELRAANHRARSLQAMASTLRATLSFERVVEAALDVCGLAIEESGSSSRDMVGAVFLYEADRLKPIFSRSFQPNDNEQWLEGRKGIVGRALTQAEPTVTMEPEADPELSRLLTFQNSATVVCVPLRAGFQIFGAMILGTAVPIKFTREQLELFNSVADHAVIALQNAKLYQDLRAEKQRMIEADEDARKELARDLHDGPTQSVAAIAMRVNFIRSLIPRNPNQAINELEKVEKLAHQTSHEIRSMLFTLRPLVLETDGLAAAVEAVISRVEQAYELPIRLIGGDSADLLDDYAQSVVFSIVEEALSNARKYSDASQIEVRFWREDDLFVAQVEDDGVGFDIQSVNSSYSTRGSLGMVNMQERADRVDGSLRIDSRPGRGTKVTLVVPLEKHGRVPQNGQPAPTQRWVNWRS